MNEKLVAAIWRHRAATSIQRASIWIGAIVTVLLAGLASILPQIYGTTDTWLGWAGNFSGGFMGAMVAVWIFRRGADEATRATKEDNSRFRKAILAGLADFALEFLSVASSVQKNSEQSFDNTFIVDHAATLHKPTVLFVALENLARLPLESATTILKVDQCLRTLKGLNSLPPHPPATGTVRLEAETFSRLVLMYGNVAACLSMAIEALDTAEAYPRTTEQAQSYSGPLGPDDRHLLSDLHILMTRNMPRRGAITDMRPIETLVGRDESLLTR